MADLRNDWEKVGKDWDALLADEFKKPDFQKLREFLTDQYNRNTVYPKKEEIFNALRATSYEQTRVVMLGQDPYPTHDNAHGLAFSVPDGVTIPDSLRNIFDEINRDIGCSMPTNNGNLMSWTSENGVLLLNAALTLEKLTNGDNNPHADHWKPFTKLVLEILNEKASPVVFLLWGDHAKCVGADAGLYDGLDKDTNLNRKGHLVLEATHPGNQSFKDTRLSKKCFFGCKHFSQTNTFLKDNGLEPIDWQIPNVK